MKNLRYCYIDESYKCFDGYHNCIVGGLIVSPVCTVKYNHRINDILTELLIDENRYIDAGLVEMHLNDLFPEVSDDLKFEALNSVIKEASQWDIKIFAYHLKFSKKDMKRLLTHWHDKENRIMYWDTFLKLYRRIREHFGNEMLIQPIIDAGFDRSFKKDLHPLYMTNKRGYENHRILSGVNEKIDGSDLSPLFTDSQDERLIQIVDLVIGTIMWQIEKKSKPFNHEIIEIVKQLDTKIIKYQERMAINTSKSDEKNLRIDSFF